MAKPFLRYPGGKKRALPYILPLLPERQTLISPFLGGGSIELAYATKYPRSRVVGYELFEPLGELWEQAIADPNAVADWAEQHYPPYPEGTEITTEQFNALRDDLRDFIDNPAEADPVEIAAKAFLSDRLSFSGAMLSGGKSKKERGNPNPNPRYSVGSVKTLRGFKAPNFKLKRGDSLPMLEGLTKNDRSDRVVLYLDPPYEGVKGLYGDRGSTHNGFDHGRLREILGELDDLGYIWVLSGNEAMAESGYPGAQNRASWKGGMARDKKRTAESEVIFRSQAAVEAGVTTEPRKAIKFAEMKSVRKHDEDMQQRVLVKQRVLQLVVGELQELNIPEIGDGLWWRRDLLEGVLAAKSRLAETRANA